MFEMNLILVLALTALPPNTNSTLPLPMVVKKCVNYSEAVFYHKNVEKRPMVEVLSMSPGAVVSIRWLG